jgi:glycosyltransferase involved in cell wall biosynthesis
MDRESLTWAVVDLVSDSELRHRLGEAAADEVRAKYTWAESASALIDLYREAVEADR